MAIVSGYYDLSNFINVRYALNIALTNYFSELLFSGDNTRVVYATTKYAFRKRIMDNTEINLNTLNFPFLNFKIKEISKYSNNQTARKLFNNAMNTRGIYIPELSKKLRYTPIEVNYDCTLFYHRDEETQFGFDELLWQASNETLLHVPIVIDSKEVNFSAYVGLNLNFEPTYDETTALKQNRIHSISINPNITTIILKSNEPGTNYCIPERLILDFYSSYNENPGDMATAEQLEWIIDHFNEENIPD